MHDPEKLIRRITRVLNQADPLEALASKLSATDLQSLLLHVFRRRSASRSAAQLLDQFERRPMVQPCTADARALVEIEREAFACAAGFEAVDWAPVTPLGLNAVLGRIDQNNCLATVRNAEVLADPTTAAALECARRRRAGMHEDIKLCSRSRPLRLQPLDQPGFYPHFALFSLVTAARARGSFETELAALRGQLRVFLRLLDQRIGLRRSAVEVTISDTQRDEMRIERAQHDVLGPLAREFPDASFAVDTQREQGRDYYRGLCLGVHARSAASDRLNLADGGFTDWTQRLLSNAKERLLVSAIGIERIERVWPR